MSPRLSAGHRRLFRSAVFAGVGSVIVVYGGAAVQSAMGRNLSARAVAIGKERARGTFAGKLRSPPQTTLGGAPSPAGFGMRPRGNRSNCSMPLLHPVGPPSPLRWPNAKPRRGSSNKSCGPSCANLPPSDKQGGGLSEINSIVTCCLPRRGQDGNARRTRFSEEMANRNAPPPPSKPPRGCRDRHLVSGKEFHILRRVPVGVEDVDLVFADEG